MNFFGLPRVTVVVSDRDVTGLEIGRDAPGVRVSGRLVSPGPSSATFSATTIILSGLFATGPAPATAGNAGVIVTGSATSYQARADVTGAFEFLRVPPGNYSLRALPGAPVQPMSLVVADKDITNFEVPIPFRRQVSGRVVLEDGRAWQPSSGNLVEFRSGIGFISTSIQNGSFTIPLEEGEYQVGVRGLPLGYVLKSVTVGGTPLTGALRIAPGSPDPTNLVITLASVSLESIQGVKVSGRITGLPPSSLAGTGVSVIGPEPATSTITTTANADGTFEFAKVPQGTYTARLDRVAPNGIVITLANRFVVGTDNITGLEIPGDVRTAVNGRVSIVDANGAVLSALPGNLAISFRRATSVSGTSIRPDGTFAVSLSDGEYSVSFDPLPAGYTVQSVVSGSTDLLKNPLKVNNASPPALIEVRVEASP